MILWQSWRIIVTVGAEGLTKNDECYPPNIVAFYERKTERKKFVAFFHII